jgi:hypothetical protein
MRFSEFLDEMAFSTGVVPNEHKQLLQFDDTDKQLYQWAKAKFNAVAAAKVILARYGYLRPDLQQKAIESGVYFKDINENVPGSPGILVFKNKEFPIQSNIRELRNRIKDQIPLLTRWGGRAPSAKTGIDYDRLSKGFQLNYHAKADYSNNELWQSIIKADGSRCNSQEEFKQEFTNPHALNFNMKLGSTHVDHDQIIRLINDRIKSKFGSVAPPGDIKKVLDYLYLNLGKIASNSGTIQSSIGAVFRDWEYKNSGDKGSYTPNYIP